MRELKPEDVVIGSELASGAIVFEAEHCGLARLVKERLCWLVWPTYHPCDQGFDRKPWRHYVREKDFRNRDMVELHHLKGLSYSEIGRRFGIDHQTAASRVRKLTAGLMREEYVKALSLHGMLGWRLCEIARERYVLGLSRYEIAERHRKPLRMIDQYLRYIDGLVHSTYRAGYRELPRPAG